MAKLDITPLKASDLKVTYNGPRDIKKIAIQRDTIRLSGDGMFYTLQGEGPTLGYPAVFVRLHHCNLACTWCDAYYTWDKSSKEFWTESWAVDFDSITNQIERTWPSSAKGDRRIVWTGGEPLMQKAQIDSVMALLWKRFDSPFWHPEIETNATIMPTDLQLENYQFNASPKLPNGSGNYVSKAYKPAVIKALNAVNSTFKFVCSSVADLDEVEGLYGKLMDYSKVIIMPEGVVEEEITKHARLLAEPCKERGLRMMPRFQAIAFDGAKRGI